MIQVKIANLFESNAKTLVNTVNCVGVMGKGIAQQFKNAYPDMFKDYVEKCKAGEVKPGVPYIYKNDASKISIINFPTKDHWRLPALLQYIIQGLDIFIDNYIEWGVESVAFPPLGCGNGGLEWSMVGPIMFQKLSSLNIPIELYAPYGTSSKLLSNEYLINKKLTEVFTEGAKNKKLRSSWVTLIEVLARLEKQKYASLVGRVVFQKICYIMTELNVDTNFHFKAASYGPFSKDVKSAINILSNANLLHEEQLGKMIQLKVGAEYEKFRYNFQDQIELYENQISKTVDLFSRIKSTDQAEEVATILYAARQLKRERNVTVSEKDLYDHILNWKKKWQCDEKKISIADTIRNLEMLNWLKLNYSNDLPEQAD